VESVDSLLFAQAVVVVAVVVVVVVDIFDDETRHRFINSD